MRHAGGRMRTQCLALFAAAPFVLLAGQTGSMPFLIASLIAWGFLKGVYDANIFASAYDVVPAPARGSVAGWMNLIGWLGGGGTAPLVIGIIAEYRGLSFAISSAALMYLLGGVLLATGILFTVRRDAARIEAGA
jgi:sugar phosphate permease